MMNLKLKFKKRLAFKMYLIITGTLGVFVSTVIILFMLNVFQQSFLVGKSTLMGIKSSDYVGKIKLSSTSLQFYIKDYLANLSDEKRPSTDDIEIEFSTFSENVLGLAGESKQIEVIAAEGDKLVEVNQKLVEKVNAFLQSSKTANKEANTKSINEMMSDVGLIEAQAGKARDTLTASFSDGFQKMLTYEERMKQMIYLGVFIALLTIVTATIAIQRALRMLTDGNTKISESSELVNESSQKASESAVRLSELVSEQSAAVHETAAALDEIAATVDKTMETMGELTAQAESSYGSTEKGIVSVKIVEDSIEEIRRVNEEMKHEATENNKRINAINDIIKNISIKTQVINDIVFQTKLLSFNASVEAARAGEQGKGFAVVAEEVGNLANMSGNAAKEISDMLDSGTREVNQITIESEKTFERILNKSTRSVDTCATNTKSCSEAIVAIADEVKSSKEKVVELKNATSEQTAGIHNIKAAMNELQSATNEVSVLADNSAQLGNAMNQNYHTLKSAIDILNLVVHGGVVNKE